MLTLAQLDLYLQEEFKFDLFKNIDTINGIQVMRDNSEIKKMAFAVDGSLETIESAIEQKVDVLLVHHGFFWGSPIAIRDKMYKKIQVLLDANVALYAIHLPLDAHMSFGNNVQIAKRLGLDNIEEFGEYKGLSIGVQGIYNKKLHLDDVYEMLFRDDNYAVKGRQDIPIVQATRFSKSVYKPIGSHQSKNTDISKVAIISGGGTKDIVQAYEQKADLYITGDASHTAWLEAQELGMNVCFAGHYFTEVWGVMALGARLQEIFDIESIFINNPTNL